MNQSGGSKDKPKTFTFVCMCVCVGGGREKFHLIKFFGGQQQKERNAQLMAGMSLEWPYK